VYFADWTGTENGDTSAIVRPRISVVYTRFYPLWDFWTKQMDGLIRIVWGHISANCGLNRVLVTVLLMIAAQSRTNAQLRFDVASIRPTPDRREESLVVNPGGFIYSRVSLKDCLEAAYGVKRYRPVLDKTGLEGRYDFTLALASAPGAGADGIKRSAFEEGFSLFAYALDQIGLRLEAQRALVEMLVVDHVEKTPTEN
jgi:Protein of unknown function (DUF3738)